MLLFGDPGSDSDWSTSSLSSNSKVGPGFSHYLSNHDPEFWFPREFLLSKNWKTFQKEEGCSKQYMTELETK